ncbi:MAG: hypothetical protein IJ880_11605 [Bacilli bacterium]|nr:hypothetical protein [Bacilli bacterium]
MIEVWALFPAFALGFTVACFIFMFFTCKHDYETRIHKVEKLYNDGMLKKTYWKHKLVNTVVKLKQKQLA